MGTAWEWGELGDGDSLGMGTAWGWGQLGSGDSLGVGTAWEWGHIYVSIIVSEELRRQLNRQLCQSDMSRLCDQKKVM